MHLAYADTSIVIQSRPVYFLLAENSKYLDGSVGGAIHIQRIADTVTMRLLFNFKVLTFYINRIVNIFLG